MRMEYREFAPVPPLAGAVHCIWTLTGDARELDAPLQPVLPDGRPELVLHFGDAFEQLNAGGGATIQPRMLVAGQLTQQLVLQPTGRIAVLGVRFHPFGAASLLPVPQQALSGITVGLDAVSTALHRRLDAVMSETGDPGAAVARVQSSLVEMLDPSRIDRRVRFVVDEIGRTRGSVAIETLARRTSMTRRHLERAFLRDVGLTPKRLARIARLQHALSLLERRASGTHTAAACGYADQAHFTRDFRKLCGCSPSEHLLGQAEMTGLFIERPRRS